MKKSSKRILVSVLTLVLTVVALTTTTFAWFSLSNVSNVSGIEGSVVSGEGLEVSINNQPFKNNLSSTDFHEYVKDVVFAAVNTTDNSKFTKLAFNTTEKRLQLGEDADKNIDYFEFELTFRSIDEGDVLLTSYEFGNTNDTQTEFNPENLPYQKSSSDTAASIQDPFVAFSANAARLSFANGKTYQHGNINDNDTTNKPQEYGQWSYLMAKGVEVYDKDTNAKVTDIKKYSMLEAETKVDTSDNNNKVVNLTRTGTDNYATGTTTVRVWIEGWDVDAYDAIFNLVLKLDLVFELKKQ